MDGWVDRDGKCNSFVPSETRGVTSSRVLERFVSRAGYTRWGFALENPWAHRANRDERFVASSLADEARGVSVAWSCAAPRESLESSFRIA